MRAAARPRTRGNRRIEKVRLTSTFMTIDNQLNIPGWETAGSPILYTRQRADEHLDAIFVFRWDHPSNDQFIDHLCQAAARKPPAAPAPRPDGYFTGTIDDAIAVLTPDDRAALAGRDPGMLDRVRLLLPRFDARGHEQPLRLVHFSYETLLPSDISDARREFKDKYVEALFNGYLNDVEDDRGFAWMAKAELSSRGTLESDARLVNGVSYVGFRSVYITPQHRATAKGVIADFSRTLQRPKEVAKLSDRSWTTWDGMMVPLVHELACGERLPDGAKMYRFPDT
ncbi:MAG: hypothetical protein IT432_04120 [Phycisphaerales bacterium]|nr:hypothetical protein [Phycisphaerales bacterium]